jgi:DNA-binding transcriptional MocR family regulator
VPSYLAFDQYSKLIASGIDFVVIEDTGKTWPTAELKASILAISPSLFDAVYDIYADLLLHVSPFTIRLLTEFVRHSIRDKGFSIQEVVRKNRETLHSAILGMVLRPVEENHASVAWIETVGPSGDEVAKALAKDRVYVLRGNRFFWSDHTKGENFIRVALTRTPHVFEQACALIEKRLRSEGWID